MSSVLDEEEIIAMLTHTSLPTILVEGDDDVAIYRWIEDRIGIFAADVHQCGGRNTLLSVFVTTQPPIYFRLPSSFTFPSHVGVG